MTSPPQPTPASLDRADRALGRIVAALDRHHGLRQHERAERERDRAMRERVREVVGELDRLIDGAAMPSGGGD